MNILKRLRRKEKNYESYGAKLAAQRQVALNDLSRATDKLIDNTNKLFEVRREIARITVSIENEAAAASNKKSEQKTWQTPKRAGRDRNKKSV